MEFRPSESIIFSAGNRINKTEAQRQHKSGKESFTTQLDSFTAKCKNNHIGNEIVCFQHTEMLTTDQHSRFHKYFCEQDKKRSENLHTNNEKKYLRKSRPLPNFVKRREQIDRSARLGERSSEHLEHTLFLGYRITVEFHRSNGFPTDAKINSILRKIRGKNIYETLWPKKKNWRITMQKAIMKDISLKTEDEDFLNYK